LTNVCGNPGGDLFVLTSSIVATVRQNGFGREPIQFPELQAKNEKINTSNLYSGHICGRDAS
jgi:hypothetical protein